MRSKERAENTIFVGDNNLEFKYNTTYYTTKDPVDGLCGSKY